MKNFLFLCFVGASSISFGQQQQNNPVQSESPSQIEKQQVSKISKIEKRVKPIRSKEAEKPAKKEESVKKD